MKFNTKICKVCTNKNINWSVESEVFDYMASLYPEYLDDDTVCTASVKNIPKTYMYVKWMTSDVIVGINSLRDGYAMCDWISVSKIDGPAIVTTFRADYVYDRFGNGIIELPLGYIELEELY